MSAVFENDLTIAIHSVRAADSEGHDQDAISAYAVERGEPPQEFESALLSTAYDANRHQHTASCELYMADEEYPRRAAGSAICGTSLDLGCLQLNLAFFDWSLAGGAGIGRYDVLMRK